LKLTERLLAFSPVIGHRHVKKKLNLSADHSRRSEKTVLKGYVLCKVEYLMEVACT